MQSRVELRVKREIKHGQWLATHGLTALGEVPGRSSLAWESGAN